MRMPFVMRPYEPGRSLDDRSAIGYLTLDPLGMILAADSSALLILSTTEPAAVGRPLRYYIDRADTERLRDYLVECTASPTTCRLHLGAPRAARGELLLSCRPSSHDGAEAYDAVIVAIAAAAPPPYSGGEDGRLAAPSSARLDMARQLIAAQESERQHIARELHDQLGQHLIALTVGLKQLELLVGADKRPERVLSNLREACDVLGQDIHRLALQLRPSALDHMGLGPAVVSYVEQTAQHAQLAIDVQCTLPHGFSIDPFTSITVYRIVQEAFNNIVKHARARHTCVIIGAQDETLRVVIEDDGIGFMAERATAGAVATNGRLGLRGMHERAALIGGTLQIESRRGSGTTVFLRVPAHPPVPPPQVDRRVTKSPTVP